MGLTDVITYPLKIAGKGIKAAKRGAEKGFRAVFPEETEEPITAVISSRYPLVHKYYWESLGHQTDMVGGNLVVWNKSVDAKKREELLKKITG